MTKSLLISFSLLEREEITGVEFIYLYYLYSDENLGLTFNEIDNKKLEQKKLIKIIENNTILRQKSIDLIEFSLVEVDVTIKNEKIKVKKSNRAIGEEVNTFIDEFRNKWKGLKPGAMGSRKACEAKLTKWLSENQEYSFEEILKAADLYLSTEGRDIRFLQRADYFIYKNDLHRNEMSRLSAYIDDVTLGTAEDWTSNLN